MTTFGFDKALEAMREGAIVTRREWAPTAMLFLSPGRRFRRGWTDAGGDAHWYANHEDLLARDWERVTMADKPAPKPDPSRTDSKPDNPRRTDTDIPDPGGDRKS